MTITDQAEFKSTSFIGIHKTRFRASTEATLTARLKIA
jgi:hypothetical protein